MRTRNQPLAPAAKGVAGVSIRWKHGPVTSVVGLVRFNGALPVLVMRKRRESETPARTGAGNVNEPPSGTATLSQFRNTAMSGPGGGMTLPLTVKSYEPSSASLLWVEAVPVSVPGVLQRMRTRN